MPKENQGGLGGYAAVALIAFLVGRCGTEDAPATNATETENAQLFSQPPSDVTQPPAETPQGDPKDTGKPDEPDEPQEVKALPASPEVDSDPDPVAFIAAPQSDAKPAQASSVYYRNCSHARAMGAAPVRVGDPGYSRKLDRDGDGIGCE